MHGGNGTTAEPYRLEMENSNDLVLYDNDGRGDSYMTSTEGWGGVEADKIG